SKLKQDAEVELYEQFEEYEEPEQYNELELINSEETINDTNSNMIESYNIQKVNYKLVQDIE
ncbi:1493_t:CDS:1, partial [Scutellospora calospora]